MKAVDIYLQHAIILLISFTAILIIYYYLVPSIERVIQSYQLESMINQLNYLASVVEDVSKEAVGSQRKISLNIPSGFLYIDNFTNSIYFEDKVYSDIISSSLYQRFGRVFLFPIENYEKTSLEKINVKLEYFDQKIIISNFEKLPKGVHEIYIIKIGEIERNSIIYIGTKKFSS